MSKQEINSASGVVIGGSHYSISDVSSRYFGPMYAIFKDGEYYKYTLSESDAVKLVLSDTEFIVPILNHKGDDQLIFRQS